MNRELIASFFRMNPETILGNKPLTPGPFGLCPYCHDAMCADGKDSCDDCAEALKEESK